MGFRLLGPVEVWMGQEKIAAGPVRQLSVLAALLVDCGRPVPADVLVGRVWGPDAPNRAPRTLQTYVARLRPVVAGADARRPARLVRDPVGYVLDVDPDAVDLHRFCRIVEQARGQTDALRLTLLREAMALWRGQPLSGIPGEWAERMRRSWQQRYVDAAVAWAQVELRTGDPERVCGQLREVADENPLVEPLIEVHMRGLAALGRTAEALECYHELRRQLADEMGVDPGTEVQETYQALLRGERTVVPAPLVPAVQAPGDTSASGPVERMGEVPATPTSDCGSYQPRGTPVFARYLAVAAAACAAWLLVGLPEMAAYLLWSTLFLGLGAGVAVTPRLGRRARAVLAAVVLVAVLAQFVAGGRRPSPLGAGPAQSPPSRPTWQSGTTVVIAHTLEQAPLFNAAGRLIQNVPAGLNVEVRCWYPGNPPKPWHADGVQYHITFPAVGHIPEPYLAVPRESAFTSTLPVPHCQYASS